MENLGIENTLDISTIEKKGEKKYLIRQIDMKNKSNDEQENIVNIINTIVEKSLNHKSDPERSNILSLIMKLKGAIPGINNNTYGDLLRSPVDSSLSFLIYNQSDNPNPIGCFLAFITNSNINSNEKVMRLSFWGVIPEERNAKLAKEIFEYGLKMAKTKHLAIEGLALGHTSMKLAKSFLGRRIIQNNGFNLSIHEIGNVNKLVRLTPIGTISSQK